MKPKNRGDIFFKIKFSLHIIFLHLLFFLSETKFVFKHMINLFILVCSKSIRTARRDTVESFLDSRTKLMFKNQAIASQSKSAIA